MIMWRKSRLLTGFTLVELMIVVALILIFAALTLPMSFGTFQKSTLKDQAKNLENSLRRAQALAMTGYGDSNVGVKISQNNCIIFERDSFGDSQRPSDTAIPFSAKVSVDGDDEIVFQRLTGLLKTPPEGEASTTLTLGKSSQTITINAQGKIERYDQGP